jgi:3-oxoacyl-[acyl-carrier protein] reductase
VPVGRNGQPEDIANAFLFLASEEASFLTGQTILIDGGVSLSLTQS